MDELIDFEGYSDILDTLYDLDDFINEKTIYIAHNILLFYKDVISRKEYTMYEKKKSLDAIYQSLVDEESSYQKYKR